MSERNDRGGKDATITLQPHVPSHCELLSDSKYGNIVSLDLCLMLAM